MSLRSPASAPLPTALNWGDVVVPADAEAPAGVGPTAAPARASLAQRAALGLGARAVRALTSARRRAGAYPARSETLAPLGAEPTGPAARRIHVREKRKLSDRLRELFVYSPALGRTVGVRVLLPGVPSEQAPALYLFHGGGDDFRSWTDLGNAEALTAHSPHLVVMPDAGAASYSRHALDDGSILDWPAFHTIELPALIAELHSVRAGPRGRLLAGLSMGGYGAMKYAAWAPGSCRAAAAFSSPLDPLAAPPLFQIVALREGARAHSLFGPVRTSRQRWEDNSPLALAAGLRGTDLWFTAGSGRPDPDDPAAAAGPDRLEAAVSALGERFHARLDELRIDHAWHPRPAGAHSWHAWQRELHRWLGHLAELERSHRPGRLDDHHRGGEPDQFGGLGRLAPDDGGGLVQLAPGPGDELGSLGARGRGDSFDCGEGLPRGSGLARGDGPERGDGIGRGTGTGCATGRRGTGERAGATGRAAEPSADGAALTGAAVPAASCSEPAPARVPRASLATAAGPASPPAQVAGTAGERTAVRTAEPVFASDGWYVALSRWRGQETVFTAGRDGFALTGAGTFRVRTPALYRPGALYLCEVASPLGGSAFSVRADAHGRLDLTGRLGAALHDPIVPGPRTRHFRTWGQEALTQVRIVAAPTALA
ncbi:alpha/beta hydrolase [Brevibacterium rongguiense]|uniref:alpha/beta hydrolase n=1 Tax=Brevibacterium rongguiense TaxID=2695267 RepID=UPI001F415C42|nr:alpha/beta fold hydrolase [Brevibacterium rongguiense]